MLGHRGTDGGAVLIGCYILINKERLKVATCLFRAAVTALVHGLTAVDCMSCYDCVQFAVGLKSASADRFILAVISEVRCSSTQTCSNVGTMNMGAFRTAHRAVCFVLDQPTASCLKLTDLVQMNAKVIK